MAPDWADKIELVSNVANTYNIQITREEFLRIVKVKDLLELIIKKFQGKPNANKPDESVIWMELQSSIAEELGVNRKDIELETRFYEDLNCGGKVVNGVPYNPLWVHPMFIIILGGLAGLTTFFLIWYFRH